MSKTTIVLAAALAVSAAGAVGGCESMQRDRQAHRHAEHEESTIETQIAVTDLPEPVRTAFQKDHPGAKINRAVREQYPDGLIHYEIYYTDKDGKKHEVEYDADGEQLEDH